MAGGYGALPQGANPYDYARPLSKGKQTSQKKKKAQKGDQFGKLDDFEPSRGHRATEIMGATSKNDSPRMYGRHNSENFDGAPGMTIQQKMKLKKLRGQKGAVMTPQAGDDKDCTIF